MVQSPIGPLLDFDARIVSLLGAIGDNEVNLLIDLLLRLDAQSENEITLYLSCQGGDVVQALKILDTLRVVRSPVTAAAFGLVEGAAVVVLAACERRIVFPSALLSTGGLWSLPELHPDGRQPMGLGGGVDPRHQLTAKVKRQVDQSFAAAPQILPSFLTDPAEAPRLFNAVEAIEVGLADTIVTGHDRRLLKPVTKKFPYENTTHLHL